MDIYDEEELNSTTIEIDAPGMTKEEIKIAVFEGTLSISYETPRGALDSGPSRFYRQRERQSGYVTRILKLPVGTQVCRRRRCASIQISSTDALSPPRSRQTSRQTWNVAF